MSLGLHKVIIAMNFTLRLCATCVFTTNHCSTIMSPVTVTVKSKSLMCTHCTHFNITITENHRQQRIQGLTFNEKCSPVYAGLEACALQASAKTGRREFSQLIILLGGECHNLALSTVSVFAYMRMFQGWKRFY